jgi:release factor glutamine methyltransferase
MIHKIIKFVVMTVDEAYKALFTPLKKIYEEREAANIADWVFESITGINRLKRVTERSRLLDITKTKILDDCLARLINHEPVQYVLHEAWFFKMKLFVNEYVLIPRSETEELVEWIIDDIQSSKVIPGDNTTILDIGSGSGCIAIALKKEIRQATLYSIDISEPALSVARHNAEIQQVKINFLQIDFLNENQWDSLPSFDFMISNPPYIPKNEKIKLNKNVVGYEPHLALFVEDTDPFIFYKKIIAFAGTHLQPGGKIYVEVHEDYSRDIADLFLRAGYKPVTKKDIHGRDRMICAFR